MGVILNPGSGKSALASILENRRAVGIMKNKAQKEFVMQRLMEAVWANNVAPGARPPPPSVGEDLDHLARRRPRERELPPIHAREAALQLQEPLPG